MPHGSSNVTPAKTDGTYLLETLAFQHLSIVDQSGSSLKGVSDAFRKGANSFFDFFASDQILLKAEYLVPEEIRDEDPSAHALSQDISSL